MKSDPDLTFHLHRRFNMRPFRRFAITVTYDPKRPAGYRITDHDPKVADATFMAVFDSHMKTPQKVWGGAIEDGFAYSTHELAEPGTESLFTTAVRNVPKTAVMPYARKP